MLLFIKSVNLAINEETGPKVISKIRHDIYADIKNLSTFFLKIQEDFEIMVDQFDKKFDTLIHSYLQHYGQEEEKKEQSKIDKPVASHTVLNHSSLLLILPKIVFQNFLIFYDEYSYAINERIANLHASTIEDLDSKLRNISNFKTLIQSKIAKNEDYKKFKYLDLHYFREKLEKKLSTIFKKTVIEIRRILYGYQFEDEAMERAYIELFYDIVLYYRQHGFKKSAIGPLLWTDNIPRSLISYENIILDTMRQHADFISCNLSLLYNYHQAVSQKFNVSVTRFDIYEKLLKIYGSIENAPFRIGPKEKEIFKEHVARLHSRLAGSIDLYQGSIISELQKHIFIHINYNTEENLHKILFDEIKDVLISIYT